MPKPDPTLTKDGVPVSLNAEAARERLNLYLQMLKSLTLTGMDLAQDVARHTRAMLARAADGAWEPDLNQDPGSAFIKLSQCVRRTIALDLYIRERLEPGAGNPFAERVTRTMPSPPAPAPACLTPDGGPKIPDLKPDIDSPSSKLDIVCGRAVLMRELGNLHDAPQTFAGDRNRPIFQTIAAIVKDMGLETGWTRYNSDTCRVFGQAYEPKAPWFIKTKRPVAGVPGYRVYPDRIEVIDDPNPVADAPVDAPLMRQLC